MSLGEALETARRARGLTQEELAKAIGVKQATLSRYEQDRREPDDETLANLAEALGVTESFLLGAGRLHGAMAIDAHMRKKATAKPTVWRQLEAKLNMYRMHARQLFEEVSVRTSQHLPTFDPFDTDPASAARMVRMQWKMPIGSVRNLTQWVEAAGCLVIEEDFGTARVDGLSQWIGEYPIMLINMRAPTDRKRLTIAHELGHLCLHATDVSEDMEQEANAFAGEFLMPAEVIRPQLRTLTLGKLHDLKREWGTSMQALIERANDLGLVTPSQRTNLYKSLSAYGWRTREPLSEELAVEAPQLLHSITDALSSKGFTASDIAEKSGFAPGNVEQPFRPARARLLRAV
ncbi:XRE family transcriptional regulator [Micromonospora sp. NPDC049645]|uniref:helix-turn-helix domain-containing protein n=1 Tax=Micromonospora sp. NPDC049645 TaxID=3155508 RepID=UPI003427DE05